MNFSSIDIFCTRIDNFGDAGVTHRFARELKAARPGIRVRVFIDDLATLGAIAGGGIDPQKDVQEYGSITYINTLSLDNGVLIDDIGVSDVMVEMFACHIPERLMELAYFGSALIINLEYLSAEDWVEGYHLKESLLGRGSVRKFYFMPGFRRGTGGLILNSRLEEARRAAGGIDRVAAVNNILAGAGVGVDTDNVDIGGDSLIGTVFTYERGFDTLLTDLVGHGADTTLLVFGDKSRRGMRSTLGRLGVGRCQPPDSCRYKNVGVVEMPFIDQHAYDTLLCCTDFNIVRGEDSLARAVLSARPFVWNAYIQEDNYQLVKVGALLAEMRQYYDDGDIFASYGGLMLDFNSLPSETAARPSPERYTDFFKNLKKHAHSAGAMYYIMVRDCDLIANFIDYIDNYRIY